MVELNQTLFAILSIFSFVLGAVVGSFLNVCIYRWPNDLSVIRPRSRCPQCENPIAWYDNIPLISWLMLGAKCRHCGTVISWLYPLVEAITALSFFLVFWRFGISLATPVYMAFAAAMIVVTFVDLTDWTIPNEITFPGIPAGIVLALVAMIYPDSGLHLDNVYSAIGGAFLGGGVLYLMDVATWTLLKKRGMGFGDVKLNAMVGAWFGWQAALINIVLASLVGTVIGVTLIAMNRTRKEAPKESENEEGSQGHYLPFGPYLALGGLIIMYIGVDELISWYLNLANLNPV